VTDYTLLFQMAGSIALVVAPVILINQLLAGNEGPSLTDILAIPVDPPRPRGVQEEEPVPWRIERLSRRVAPSARWMPRGADKPAIESGPCA
jgi:hypothetical protein